MTVGSGHSPSDMTMTKEWLCNLDRFNQVLKKEEFSGPTVNGEGEEVKFVDLTVQAGCRIYELNRYLKENELAIQNLGSISDQSMAGVISTGTHGSTQYHGLVSQQVVSIEIMNSAGKLITCSSMENTQLFKAAMLSLGKIWDYHACYAQNYSKVHHQVEARNHQVRYSFEKLGHRVVRLGVYQGVVVSILGQLCLLEGFEVVRAIIETKRFMVWHLVWKEVLRVVVVDLGPHMSSFDSPIQKFVFKNQYGDVETLGHGDVAVQNSVEGLNMDCLLAICQ